LRRFAWQFVVITRQMSVVSPEHLPAIMERFAKWREEYEDRTESFEFFAGGDEGSWWSMCPTR
jgi:hypothetical protein